ncbi:Uncharacterized protein OBRU01_07668, partial [Operophtera brumata]
MGEAYFNLKRKLEELGYNNLLPIDSVPLVECILADLLQTTRSLQHYMDLSKEALMQRDSLMLEAEPYKCDNAKLIQENNHIHRENMKLKEDYLKLMKESRRKIKTLSEEMVKKDAIISKLQHEVRDLGLRGLCAETLSSRYKSKRKDGDGNPRSCTCNERKVYTSDNDLTELNKKITLLENQNHENEDQIMILKNQVEHRDNEIIRLNMLLEGGRPLTAVNKDCCNPSDSKIQNLIEELHNLESTHDVLKKEVANGLEKQHEAMLRALSLADKNKSLQEELQKVDALALKVEEDCNKRLATMMNDVNFLQIRVDGLTMKNSELERQISGYRSTRDSTNANKEIQESLNLARKENEALQREIKDLVDLNKSLQEKIMSMSNTCRSYEINHDYAQIRDRQKCPTKDELQVLLEHERLKYEKQIMDIHEKMSETLSMFNKHIMSKSKGVSPPSSKSHENAFIRDLHAKLCESEQRMLMLKKENNEMQSKVMNYQENNKQNYKDVINQLNVENSELSKENIALSQQLSHYKNMNSAKSNNRDEYTRREVDKLKDTIGELSQEILLLKKDKNEYNLRYKESMEVSDKLKRDLIRKQKEIEQLEEENSSYKMTNRTGKASTDHLKDECNFLKEQIKKMQSDVIKEKTLASQIKNIQIETERSNTGVQNELLSVQRKLSLSKDTIDSLEKKCKELQSEIAALRNDKSNLIDNIRQVDQERDKLVIELDHKTEQNSVLEQKLNSQIFEISKLHNEISDLKRKLNISKVSEHKLLDTEQQMAFLNGEILRLNQQLDTAIIENKHLQNSLADLNGTMKVSKIEYDKSRKEVEGLKQQLQHYVSEIRRIEELLSQKEADRSDMLEQFASLSVEANILENTNHSLESESASKSMQLQTYISKIENLESLLLDKENIIESQSARIASMSCRVNSLKNEIKLVTEEKAILEQNVAYLKQMCSNLQTESINTVKGLGNVDSELKLYENRIKSLSGAKASLEVEKETVKESLMTTERLLGNARKEIVDLKLALQDATSETKSLQDRLTRRESEIHETTLTREEYDLPLMLEEIHEVSHEEDEDSSRYRSLHKRLSKYTHS